MDPNVALANLRDHMAELNTYLASPSTGECPGAAIDMAEQLAALDAWLSGGGFLPEAWSTRAA